MHPVITIALSLLLALPAAAETAVGITPDMPQVTLPDGAVIARPQDQTSVITGEFALTARACPPFCVQPMQPAAGVTTIGELELIAMLQDPQAIVLDSRTADWFRRGSIPGALHMPYTDVVDRLAELGCEADFDGWDCDSAGPVALFCNGSWCGQSPTAIRNMISVVFPAERIFYYRGGMQAWHMLGLTVTGGS
jgi:rhodanese-related sulfurtransferase